MSRFLARCLLLCAAVAFLAACQAEVLVTVEVEDEPGAGLVTVEVWLDREVIDRLEGIEQLRIEDLRDAGWDLDEPVIGEDSSVSLSGQKPFATPSELGEVLDEISGSDGPYSRLGLRVDRSFARTDMVFEGVLDGTVGLETFSDTEVAAALDGRPFGVDLTEVEGELGAPVGSGIALGLEVALLGEVESNVAGDGSVRWETTLDATDPVPVLATSEQTRVESVVMAVAAAGFAALFVLVLVIWVLVLARRRRRRRRAARQAASTPRPIAGAREPAPREPVPHDPDDTPVPGEGPAPAPVAAGESVDGQEDAVGPPPLRLVVVGGPGAAFGVRDPVDDLVAFARAHGSMLEYPRIAEHYAQAELGRISTSELWVAIGAEGDPSALDEALLGQYQLAPGLREFVVRARDRGYQVAYLGDGPAAWVGHLRRSFVLGDLIDPWIVSGTVGVRTPEPAMFEALRRASGVDPASCLLIDERLRVLEAAHAMGYGTAWFSPTGRATEAPGHSIIRGFADLLSS